MTEFVPMESDEMLNLAIQVAYKGAPFCGFAKQDGLLTVQGEIEKALEIVFREHFDTVCAGRTDSGVHALGQVVSVDIPKRLLINRTPDSLLRSLNALTDDAISIKRVSRAKDGFSARFDACWREYRYRIAVGSNKPLLTDEYTWWIGSCRQLDLEAMGKAASMLVGEHDFKSFCVSASAVGKSTNRCVMSVDIFEEEVLGESGIVIRVVGNAFLHSMVRTMVGTLVEVGCSRKSPEWVKEVLDARDRAAAGQTAPANGLIFWHVEYPEDAILDLPFS